MAAWIIGGHCTPAGAEEATPQRPSFTFDATLVPSGSVELEAGGSFSGSSRGLPLNVKWTPGGGALATTELSVGFDAVTSDGDSTEFGDRIVFLARHPFEVDGAWSFAIAPRATFLLRGDEGARLGAIAIAAWASGLDTLVGNASFDAATSSSATNPSTLFELSLDYYRTFGSSSSLARLTAFAGVLTSGPAVSPARSR